jgi:hypothetical protein
LPSAGEFPEEVFTFEQFLQHSLFHGCQAAVAMRFCSGQACAEFALFARLCATRGTTNRQRFLLCDFHAYTMRGNSPIRWSIVTISQSSARRIISVERVGDQRWNLRRQCNPMTAAFSLGPFSRSDPMSQQFAPNANQSPEPPRTHAGATLESERVKQPPLPEPPYEPYAEKPAMPNLPYKPYAEKPKLPESPYEPYKGM